MKNTTTAVFICMLLMSPSAMAMGENVEEKTKTTMVDEKFEHGKKAHKNHCYKCHGDDIYTRDESFVKSLDALSKQVIRCKNGSNIPWFDEDTETVIHFVNKKFYRF